MDFAYSPKVDELRARVRDFMQRYVIPNNTRYRQEVAEGLNPPPVIDELKAIAKAEGLWNMFLPGLKPNEPGTRLTNQEYAPLAEIMGQLQWASEVFNCNAPDTGNMELLHMFATPEQRERWLKPLLEGEIRSCFAMTEPDSSSSDATNISTRIESRWRPIRHQRPQVVHHRRDARALQNRHRHGDHQPQRRAPCARACARAAGHARRDAWCATSA